MIERPFTHGGTRPKAPDELLSSLLRAHGARVIAAAVERIYNTWPELGDRFGAVGRVLTTEDCLWHLGYADAAMAINDPSAFHDYADWLVRFLDSRGVQPRWVAGSFEYLADEIELVPCHPHEDAQRRFLAGLLRETALRIINRAEA
jgi:hypothetical protein